MTIQLGLGVSNDPGRALYLAIARELGGLSFSDRIALLNAVSSGKAFAELEPRHRAIFARCADLAGRAHAQAKGLK